MTGREYFASSMSSKELATSVEGNVLMYNLDVISAKRLPVIGWLDEVVFLSP